MKTHFALMMVIGLGCAASEGGGDMSSPPAAPMDASPRFDVEQRDVDAMLEDEGVQDSFVVDTEILDCEGSTQCGQFCVDTEADPLHCGGCGRTCFFPNAQALCTDGECQLGACDVGFFDVDRDDVNGCELADECVDGQTCSTACNSTGTTRCEQGLQQCDPPSEVCNAQDDNCNNTCDEGNLPGCRIAVARSYGPSGHAYHRDRGFLTDRGYNIERASYFYVYSSPYSGMRPMFLCPKDNGKFFLASGTACEPVMRSPVAEIGFWSPQPLCGSIPLFSLYKADSDNHFYTTSADERASVLANLGYEDRGIAGYVWEGP